MKSTGDISNFLSVYEVAAGVYTGYSATNEPGTSVVTVTGARANKVARGRIAYDSAPYPNNNTYISPGAKMATITISSHLADHRGHYKVLARVADTTIDATVPGGNHLSALRDYVIGIYMSHGGSDGAKITNPTGEIAAVDFTSPGSNTLSMPLPAVVDLGTIQIPDQFWPYDAVLSPFSFSLYGYAKSKTSNGWVQLSFIDLDIDCVYLIPIDEAWADITFKESAPSLSDKLHFDMLSVPPFTGLTTASDTIRDITLTPRRPDGRFLLPPNKEARFYTILLRDGDNGHSFSDTYSLDFEWYNQFSRFR